MIDCICQVPNHLPVGTELYGSTFVSAYDLKHQQHINLLSGRSVKIAPLTFYKVFSTWGQNRYEHTFVTDERFDPVTLHTYQSTVSGKIVSDLMGSILIPISVKGIGPCGVFNFLFAKNINYLLLNYRNNIPLAEISPLTADPSTYGICGLEIPASGVLSGGVHGYGEYQEMVFQDLLYNTYGNNPLTPYDKLRLSSLTPETPVHTYMCLQEILDQGLGIGDRLFDYMDDMQVYTSGQHLTIHDLFEDFLYVDNPMDPITQVCLRSPSYILLSSLAPYLGNPEFSMIHQRLGYAQRNATYQYDLLPMNFGSSTQLLDRYELLDLLMRIPETDFSLDVTWDNYIPNYTSYFGNRVDVPNIKVHDLCRQLFLNKHCDPNAADRVIIDKTWLDDLFISCEHSTGYVTTSHINLSWFHLISPSLVNSTIFNQTMYFKK